MEDLPQGLITAVIHLHQVCCGETVVVLLLGYLQGQALETQRFQDTVKKDVPKVGVKLVPVQSKVRIQKQN